jgi:predicted dehydrogenase
MDHNETAAVTRRAFAGAAAFMIVPRHVLGAPFIPPSDRITLATIGLGRQGQAVTMNLLARPDVQVTAVCDCNRGSKDYVEYGPNQLLTIWRRLLGQGYENWGEDLASPGEVQLTREFKTSLGMGGREPVKRAVEAYYGSRKGSATGGYKAAAPTRIIRNCSKRRKIWTPCTWRHLIIGTPRSRWQPCASTSTCWGRSRWRTRLPTRRMAQMAREMKVATSLTVNNPSSEPTKLLSEWIADGAIGQVREVHNWSSRPFWPQGIDRPKETQPVPEGLDWDLWVGPAPERPYNHAYMPFVWRGWHDFGCGSFGDMGCYSFAGVFKILGLTPPTSVEASASESYDETFPKASIVHLDFPARESPTALRMSWYDGGMRPPRPAGLKPEDQHFFQSGEDNEGILYVGDKGLILAAFNGNNPRVYPESKKYQAPPRQRGERGGYRDIAVDQWLAACKGNTPAPLANFEMQSPVTEAFLLGCLAQRFPGERLEWDAAHMRITSSEKANRYVDPPARSGYAS